MGYTVNEHIYGTWANEKVCPICEKTFVVSPEWAYKMGPRWFCSWHCLRENERRIIAKNVARKKPHPENINRGHGPEIMAMLSKGYGSTDIKKALGVDYSMITYYRHRMEILEMRRQRNEEA